MNNLRPFLIAAVLSFACLCAGTGSAFPAPGLAAALAATPAARIAHSSSSDRRSHHARTSCHASSRSHRGRHRHCTPAKALHGAHRIGAAQAHLPHEKTSQQSLPKTRRLPRASSPSTLAPAGAQSAAATIASVLATPCENTEAVPTVENLRQIGEATLCLINQERARNDELPLQVNAQLTQVAQQHSQEMVAEDYFSHTTPSGETQLERVEAGGYIPSSQAGYTIGENIAWGTLYLATPSSIVAAWIASPEHLANILSSVYTETGVGVDPTGLPSQSEGQPGAMYTQEFGVIED